MTGQIQADVEQLRHVAQAMRDFNAVLHNNHRGIMGKAQSFVTDVFRGDLQALFETVITTFDPQVYALSGISDDWSTRLEALATKLEAADSSYVYSNAPSLNRFGAFNVTLQSPHFSDTSIPGPLELLKQLGLLFGASGAAINPIYVGKDLFGSLLDHPLDPNRVVSDLINKRFQQTDPAVQKFLDGLVPIPPDGGTESISFALKRNVTVPGLVVPGSGRIQEAQSAIFTRNSDGTYTLTLSSSPGVGIVETAGGGKGSITVGDKTLTLGAEAEASALIIGTTEIAYKFDPHKTGDLTKMMLFASALGMPGVPVVPVAPPIYDLADNFQSAKIGLGVEGNVNIAAALFQAEESASLNGGMALSKNETGQLELSRIVSASLSAKADTTATTLPISLSGGGSGTLEVRAIQNLDTGKNFAKVILDVAIDKNTSFNVRSLKDYLPQAQIEDIMPQNQEYQRIRIEYTLDQPYDSIKNSLFTESGPDISYITQNSHIEVKAAISEQSSLGISGDVSLPTQQIGVSGSGTIGRESERTILIIEPNRS